MNHRSKLVQMRLCVTPFFNLVPNVTYWYAHTIEIYEDITIDKLLTASNIFDARGVVTIPISIWT